MRHDYARRQRLVEGQPVRGVLPESRRQARAMANRPQLLLADEPTGNLDPRIFDGLIDMVSKEGLVAIIATHNFELAGRMDRAILIKDGKLVDGTAVLAAED